MPPLVAELRRKVKEFRDGGYIGAVCHEPESAQLVVQDTSPAAEGWRGYGGI